MYSVSVDLLLWWSHQLWISLVDLGVLFYFRCSASLSHWMLYLDVFIDLKTCCGWKETFPCLCSFSIFVCYCVILFDRLDNNFLWNTSLIFFCSWSVCGFARVCVKVAHGCVHMCMWKVGHSLRWPLCFAPRVALGAHWQAWQASGFARLCSLHQITVCATSQGFELSSLCVLGKGFLTVFTCIASHVLLLQLLVLLGWLHSTMKWNFKKASEYSREKTLTSMWISHFSLSLISFFLSLFFPLSPLLFSPLLPQC